MVFSNRGCNVWYFPIVSLGPTGGGAYVVNQILPGGKGVAESRTMQLFAGVRVQYFALVGGGSVRPVKRRGEQRVAEDARAELYAIHCVLRIPIRMRILRILFGRLCIAGIRSPCVSNGVSESGQNVCIPPGQKCVFLQIRAKIHNVAIYCTQHFYFESNFPINHQHSHTARPLAPSPPPPPYSFARFCLARLTHHRS